MDFWRRGAGFGWGDLSVIPYVNGAAGFDIVPPADSRLAGWYTRANARDSVRECAQAAAAVAFDSPAASLDQVKAAMDAGMFKREYRDHRLEWMIKTGGLSVIQDGLEKDNIRFIEPFAPVR